MANSRQGFHFLLLLISQMSSKAQLVLWYIFKLVFHIIWGWPNTPLEVSPWCLKECSKKPSRARKIYFFSRLKTSKDCSIKFCSKHSINTILCLLQNLMNDEWRYLLPKTSLKIIALLCWIFQLGNQILKGLYHVRFSLSNICTCNKVDIYRHAK